MIYKGFRFGMILQLALGPISLYIFNIAGSIGFLSALIAVLAVTIADALFILLAILGCASFLEKGDNRKWLQLIGSALMAFFGLVTILSVFHINLLPSFSGSFELLRSPFVSAFLLTVANPLTILFWAGVFTSRLSEFKTGLRGMIIFGTGAALSTLICMTLVAGLGGISRQFLPPFVLSGLNIIVGFVLIGFAIDMVMKSRQTVNKTESA